MLEPRAYDYNTSNDNMSFENDKKNIKKRLHEGNQKEMQEEEDYQKAVNGTKEDIQYFINNHPHSKKTTKFFNLQSTNNEEIDESN